MAGMRFDGRVAVITGGGRGLGREHALLLGSLGAKVVVNDPGAAIKGEGTDLGPAQAVVDEIVAAGGTALANLDSVATPEGGAAIVQAALDAWGRIDVLVHNAGNVRYGALDTISHEDFRAVIDVHMLGAFHVARAAFPVMKAAGYGRVVLTSSIGGIYGNKDCVNYAMAKSSMIGLNAVIALEGEDCNVRSNMLVPGAVTRMADGLDTSKYPPLGAELVAPAVAWLCHEDCTATGESYAVLGGRVARVFIAETPGVYQPSWTVDEVAARIDAIRDKREVLDFGLHGYSAHLGYSFAMATGGT